MSEARCCSAWKEPIGTPNCLRVFMYSTVMPSASLIAPTASAESAGDRLVDGAFDQRQRVSRGAEHGLRPDAHVGKGDVGGALAVLGRVAAPRHARRVGADEKEANPVAVAPAAGEARRHDQPVGAVALADERLLAVEHEGGAVLAGGEPDIDEIEARLLFRMGKAQAQIARRDPADKVGALFGRGGVLEEGAAKDDGLEIGLERQRLAERLHHDHRLDRAAAEAAILFGEGRAQAGPFPRSRAKAPR